MIYWRLILLPLNQRLGEEREGREERREGCREGERGREEGREREGGRGEREVKR